MTKAATVKKKWQSWKGVKEGKQADTLIVDPWNKATGCKPPANSKSNPWCAIAVASAFIQTKCSGYSKSATCKNQKAYYKKAGRWKTKGTRPNVGDVIFVTGHEGFVTSTSTNGTGTFYSGNCSNMVKPTSFNWKKATWGSKKVEGYGTPIYK